jgi:putative transposase
VIGTCLAGNGRKFRQYAVVVIPDHVHLMLALKYDANGPVGIAEIMHAINGASAHRTNKALGPKGKVWEEVSFERALRREESIGDKVDYILGNPVGAGLAKNPLTYRWLWKETGETAA